MRKIMDRKQFLALCGSVIAGVMVALVANAQSDAKPCEVTTGDAVEVPIEYSGEYARVVGEFSAKTAGGFLEGREENTCYSPTSLFAVLTFFAETTEGSTQENVLEGLGVTSVGALENMYSQMKTDANTTENDSTIRLCNSLWIQKQLLVEEAQTVLGNCQEKLDCEIFANEKVKETEVNSWVAEKTNNLIKECGLKGEETPIALINTLYYKSAWKDDFGPMGMEYFTLEDGNKIATDFIVCENETMQFAERKDYTLVSVPMDEGEMVFVLPEKNTKLNSLLTEDTLNDVLATASGPDMEEGLVTIRLPQFEISDGIELPMDNIAQMLGVESGSFGGQWAITDLAEALKMYQKTRIIVDEEGVEAAAVTEVVVYGISGGTTQLDITLDRPFMYVLMNEQTPLFIGTVYRPGQE